MAPTCVPVPSLHPNADLVFWPVVSVLASSVLVQPVSTHCSTVQTLTRMAVDGVVMWTRARRVSWLVARKQPAAQCDGISDVARLNCRGR
jgi:hypothetical protein